MIAAAKRPPSRKAPPATKALRACHYIRMSTTKQEDSPERQRSVVEPCIARWGYRPVPELVDPGISGLEASRRPAFQQLVRDAEAGTTIKPVLRM